MNSLIPEIADLLNRLFGDLALFVSELTLIVTFVLAILVELFWPGKRSVNTYLLIIAGILTSAALALTDIPAIAAGHVVFEGSFKFDAPGFMFNRLCDLSVILFAVFLRHSREIQDHRKGVGDLYLLLPGVLLGLHLMVAAVSLLSIYLSIELVSIVSYILVGYISKAKEQSEAALKYIVFGSVCSAIMLYGMSLLYAFTGTVNILSPEFADGLSRVSPLAQYVAVGLVLAGIGFKLSFVPFHFWSPDVFEGAPLSVLSFLSTAPKIAAFALLLRFVQPLYTASMLSMDIKSVLALIAIASMIAGNFAAIKQDNIKRMLAYSSIAHTGFLLMAVVVEPSRGLAPITYYLCVYLTMNMAAFMLASRIEDQAGTVRISEYKGLGKIFVPEFVCFVVVLMSLTGLPPFGGFMGKFLLFSAVYEEYTASGNLLYIALMITGAVTTVVSLFYYFKIPLNGFLRELDEKAPLSTKRNAITYISIVLTALLLIFGLFPGIII